LTEYEEPSKYILRLDLLLQASPRLKMMQNSRSVLRVSSFDQSARSSPGKALRDSCGYALEAHWYSDQARYGTASGITTSRTRYRPINQQLLVHAELKRREKKIRYVSSLGGISKRIQQGHKFWSGADMQFERTISINIATIDKFSSYAGTRSLQRRCYRYRLKAAAIGMGISTTTWRILQGEM
jgi:hypothetical protein